MLRRCLRRLASLQHDGLLGANSGTKLVFFDCCYMQQMFQSLSRLCPTLSITTRMFSSEEALIVVIRVYRLIFLVLLVPRLVPIVAGFYFLRFSGFLWAIDGPTNAAAIDPPIIVAVPGCLELLSLLGMTLDLNYDKVTSFLSLQLFIQSWSMGPMLIQLS